MSKKFNEINKIIGKSSLETRNLQKAFEILILKKEEPYSEAYFIFLKKIFYLKALHIPQNLIGELFEKEKKIIRLLHGDTITNSPTWYLDSCVDLSISNSRLPLSGFDLGFPLWSNEIQVGLDFGERENELFQGTEMGENVAREIREYLPLFKKIKQRLNQDVGFFKEAIRWSGRVFPDK